MLEGVHGDLDWLGGVAVALEGVEGDVIVALEGDLGLGEEMADVGTGNLGDATDFSSSDSSETAPSDVLV